MTAVAFDDVVDLLVDNVLLLVLLTVGLGAGAGALRYRQLSIGPAAALFVGLGIGALDEGIAGATGLGLVRELGLVLFTYTLGLASGPTFVAGLKRGGLAAIGVTIVLVGALTGLAGAAGGLLGLSPAERAGVFAGAATNTPALQSAVDAVAEGDPVVAYSLAYPAAVAAMLLVLTLVFGNRIHLPGVLQPAPAPPRPEALVNWTVRITRTGVPDLGELRRRYDGIGFSRIEHDGVVSIADASHVPTVGDSLVVVGPPPAVAAFTAEVGERGDHHLPLDRSAFDFRRIVVSNRRLAGRRIGELDLEVRFGARVTRVRRGDEDIVADEGVVLALGDRVRVVGTPQALERVARELGDSERGLSELDGLGFALGLALGLAVGTVAVPVPGGADLRLGAAGGPLVVGLLLGFLTRTGPITWQIPQAANLVFRQLGILVFLAAAGLGSGAAFADAIVTRDGLVLAVAGAVVALVFAVLIPVVVQLALRLDVVAAAGTFAGVETQPAALAYAVERSGGDERVDAAYALVFPVAMIAKIIAVQFLV